MTPKLVIVLGETTAKQQQLTENGEPLVGTGLDVELEIYKLVDDEMTAVETPPTAAWADEAAGIVEITGVDTLTVGSYFVRYKLTNGADEHDFVPNSEGADFWKVVPVANHR